MTGCRRTMVGVAVAKVLLGAALTANAQPNGAAHKLGPGPFKVQVVKELLLEDTARGKQLAIRVQHPDGSGPFPVIIWSHGAWGSKDNYLPLTEHWASHGYVTIQANHSDSRALGNRVGDPKVFRDWQSRPGDVSLIIDSLEKLEKKEPALIPR